MLAPGRGGVRGIYSTPRSEDFEVYGEFPFDNRNGSTPAFPGDSDSFALAPNEDMDPFALRIRSPGPPPPPPPSTPVGNTAGNRLMTPSTVSPDYLYPLDVQYLVDAFCAPPDTYRGCPSSSTSLVPFNLISSHGPSAPLALLFAYASSHHSSQGTYFASWPAEMEMIGRS
ncbi:hypothetical protein B0H14DRAFT_3756987 [Mycena olivaceomarginata]|nr:hypothetical protein B0H14DRAFT_3756987 [Mycena olivaceomarginata]